MTTRVKAFIRDYAVGEKVGFGVLDLIEFRMTGDTYSDVEGGVFSSGFGPLLRLEPEDDPARALYEYLFDHYDPTLRDSNDELIPHGVRIIHEKYDSETGSVQATGTEDFYIGRDKYEFRLMYNHVPDLNEISDSSIVQEDLLKFHMKGAVQVDTIATLSEYNNDPASIPADSELYPPSGGVPLV